MRALPSVGDEADSEFDDSRKENPTIQAVSYHPSLQALRLLALNFFNLRNLEKEVEFQENQPTVPTTANRRPFNARH
jgi:hypothetical protein